jgi:hypothetical protein
VNTAQQTVDHFLRLHRSLAIETREFETLRHNNDLCPRFQTQIETILRAVGKFEPVVYDCQGIFDDGSDLIIVVRDKGEDNDTPVRIGFQIKSYEDFEGRDLFRTLKAQRDDSFRKVRNLCAYYIVLCTDEQRDKNKIRDIEGEFKDADKTLVIEPTYGLTFIKLAARRIQGLVSRMHQTDDLVFQKALDALQFDTPTGAIVALYLAAKACEGAREFSSSDLRRDYELRRFYVDLLDERAKAAKRLRRVQKTPNVNLTKQSDLKRHRPTAAEIERLSESFFESFDEALGYDLEVLDGQLIDIDNANDRVIVRRHAMLPLIALLTDAMVRYELSGSPLFEYAAEALGVLDLVT